MLPKKCKDLGCRRHMVTDKGADVCAIEKTKRGIGVVPVFSVSEKNCRMIRLLPKSSAEASPKDGRDETASCPDCLVAKYPPCNEGIPCCKCEKKQNECNSWQPCPKKEGKEARNEN